jgi:arylsulfatase A-like enzyme
MTEQVRAGQRPDIVFFMLDQLSARWLELARGGIVPTPNIDRLAAEGVTFTRAVSSNPVCCPARATLATGLTTRQHGVLENGYQLDPALPTFMQLLQRAGWRTGCFGKLHLHPHFAGLRPEYQPYGFDVTHISEDPRGGEWLDWVEANHPSHYDAALATVWPTAVPDFADYGPQHRNLRDRILAIRRDFDWTSPEVPDATWTHYALPFPEDVSQTAWITGRALDFIAETPASQPVLAHIGYVQPHSPFCAPRAHFARVADDAIPEPVQPAWPDDPAHPACWDAEHWARRAIPDNWRNIRRCYFADIAHLDDQLGRVRAALEAAGRWDNTCLFLLADHGEMLLDHGMTGKGNMHYDACIRVPLVIAGPGLGRGRVCDEFVQLEDIFPTVLELAGAEMPAVPRMGPYLRGDVESLPGRSLLPLCRGEDTTGWRTFAYAESYNNITGSAEEQWARTVRTDRFRYTWYPGGTGEQLFDLEVDPAETRNVARDPAYAATRNELLERLLGAVVHQDYPHTRRNLYAIGVH